MQRRLIIQFACILLLLTGSFPASAQTAELAVQTGHTAPITMLEFSHNGKILASAGADNKIKLWYVPTWNEMSTLNVQDLSTFCFNPDDTQLLIGSSSGELIQWDIAHSKMIKTITLPGSIFSVCYSGIPGCFLVAADRVCKVNTADGTISDMYDERIIDITRDPVNDHFYLCSHLGHITVIDPEGKLIREDVRFAENRRERRLSKRKINIELKREIAEQEKEQVGDKNSFQQFRNEKLEYKLSRYQKRRQTVEKRRLREIDFVDYYDDFSRISMGVFPKVTTFDFTSQADLFSVTGTYIDMPFNAAASSSTHGIIVAVNDDSNIYIVNRESGKVIKKLSGHLAKVNDVCFSPDQQYFATASSDRSVLIWKSETLESETRLFSRTFPIECLGLSTSEDILGFGDEIGFTKTIDISSPELTLRSLRNHDLAVSHVEFIKEDELLLTTGLDNRIKITDRRTLDVIDQSTYNPVIGPREIIRGIKKVFNLYNEPLYFIDDLDLNSSRQLFGVAGIRKVYQSPSDSYFIRKQKVKIYDANSLKKLFSLTREDDFIFSPDPGRFLTYNDTVITTWTREGKEISKTPYNISGIDLDPIEQIRYITGNSLLVLSVGNLYKVLLDQEAKIDEKMNENVDRFILDETTGSVAMVKGNKIHVVDLADRKNEVTLEGHTGNITDMQFQQDKHVLISCGDDAMIKFWNLDTGELIYTIIPIDRDKKIIITPENYYFAPKEALNGIGFKYGNEFFPPEQFDLKFNRPDIVLTAVGSASTDLIEAYHRAYQRRLRKMNFTEEMLGEDFHLPNISINNETDIIRRTDDEHLNLVLNAWDERNKIDRINVFINDVPVYGTNGIDLRDLDTDSTIHELVLEMAHGPNKIQVSSMNQQGVESLKKTVYVDVSETGKKPDLYIISIGTSDYKDDRFDLTYASKDALDMAQLFREQRGNYNQVHEKTLLDSDVTKENILALKSFLEGAGRDDVVMLFVAGHGVLDLNYDYYYGTHDMDFNQPSDRGIEYADIESLLDGIKAIKKILFMDTCHSGEVDKEEIELVAAANTQDGEITFRSSGVGVRQKKGVGLHNTNELVKDLFADLRKGTGSTVIASAGGAEYALEGTQWSNGLFTYCVMEGLRTKKADLNGDKQVMLSELQQYVRGRVEELSAGRQVPTSRIENISMDFRIW